MRNHIRCSPRSTRSNGLSGAAASAAAHYRNPVVGREAGGDVRPSGSRNEGQIDTEKRRRRYHIQCGTVVIGY